MNLSELREKVEMACRHLLSEQNRDPYTLTYGCFDRRYWGWKLADYPEATLQRNVYPLAWLLRRIKNTSAVESTRGATEQRNVEIFTEAVQAGLSFATQIQHKDGSFDQAFPNEHSFGATAFLLHPLLKAYQIIQESCSSSFRESVENSLSQAADFLCHHDETHGHIANHLAGAALSLLASADFFARPRYDQRASELLERILTHQSPEGWFLEYEGADPGYQTLCVHYLAQIYSLRPNPNLRGALEKASSFLAWFVHPDGTFGGEYGSRRTTIFYPGGIARLSREFPLAHSMTCFMLRSITAGHTVTLADVDIGNMAPLLSSYLLLLDTPLLNDSQPEQPLPWQENIMGQQGQDFPHAGLFIRSTPRYYAVVGASNGGVVKLFDRRARQLLWNDGGYVGQTKGGNYITTQITDLDRPCQTEPGQIKIEAPFYVMLRSVPTPWQFVLLRLLNLTLMRNVVLGNWVKGVLVRLLITGKRTVPLKLIRKIQFEPDQVTVSDRLRLKGSLHLRWLECGRPFVAIHMASARYFEGSVAEGNHPQPYQVDVAQLSANGELRRQVTI